MVEDEAKRCVWEELGIRKKVLKTYVYREGYGDYEYTFTEEHLQVILDKLSRIISKYSSTDWSSNDTAQDLVSIITLHQSLIQNELDLI